ncbi:hypothetical protein [Bradyrhizobium sp. S3.2.12]|uniref:hypothetical protein n=1 Tax=Bradyrhizobium sp. S3.2.12 TaxID=3156387 RepID=UPI0033951372
MDILTPDEIAAIAAARDITYEPLPSDDPLVVSTRISRVFPISRDVAFRLFTDPASHVRLFSIIKGSSTIPREPIAKLMPPNQFWVIEHVEERDSTPRTMLVKYTLSPPDLIVKEGIPDPFGDLDPPGGGISILDKKRASVFLRMEPVSDTQMTLTAESSFQASTGSVFMRGLIDHVWLNFFENLMVELKELLPSQLMTRP